MRINHVITLSPAPVPLLDGETGEPWTPLRDPRPPYMRRLSPNPAIARALRAMAVADHLWDT